MKKMNIIFFGTPDFVIPVADSLLNTENCKLTAVVTNPDRPVGRNQILTPSPVKKWAREHNLPVLTPEKLDQDLISQITTHNPQLGLLASYGRIIPQSIIELFPKGIIVIHPSLLPKYRGPTPVPAAILCGEKETGSTFILMDEKMDHGPILYQFKSEIKPDDTASTLLYRIWKESAEKLPDVFSKYLAGEITPQTQDETKATYTKLFQKEDGFIPWDFLRSAMEGKEVKEEERFIRAMTPWPGAWSLVKIKNDMQLKILKAHVENEKLILDQVQLEGKKPVSWKQFKEAYLK